MQLGAKSFGSAMPHEVNATSDDNPVTKISPSALRTIHFKSDNEN